MKKLLLVAFVAVFAFATTSCSKEKELKGTTWTASQSESYSYEGLTVDVVMNYVMNFADETNGSLTISGTESAMGITRNFGPETANFTYTFDGTKGTLTAQGETIEFTYDKDKNTITIDLSEVDEETGETTSMILTFTEQK